MPRVLIVSANREQFPEPAFPVGAVYVAAALARRGADVRVFDAGLYRLPHVALRAALRRFRPDVVGLSLRNADNAAYPCSRFYLPDYARLVRTIRSSCNARLVLGGSAFAIFPDEIMQALGVDAGVVGDGEAVAAAFDTAWAGIRNARLRDLSGVGFPDDLQRVFPDFRRYRTIGIQTARGCPRRCIYCTYPLLEGRQTRPRSPQAVADEIERIVRTSGKTDFFFVDSLFNADERHMTAVLKAIIERRLEIRFSCYMMPAVSDPALFGLLKQAGCLAVDFGTDTGSPRLLVSFQKGFGVEDIRAVSAACRKHGIDFCHSLIFGAPGESEETIRETVTLMDEVEPRAVVAMIGVRIYPGTEMERAARLDGTLERGGSVLEPRFYYGGRDAAWLLPAVYAEVGGRSNWFFPGERDWSRLIGPRLLRLLQAHGPVWRAFRTGRPGDNLWTSLYRLYRRSVR